MIRAATTKCLARSFGTVRRTLSAASRSEIQLVLGNQQRRNNKEAVSPLLSKHPRHQNRLLQLNPNSTNNNVGIWRAFSSDANKKDQGSKTTGSSEDEGESNKAEDGSDETQIVLTPGQKVVAYSRLGMWAGILGFASVCAYYIGLELFPTKMSPNRVFDGALEMVRNDPEVRRRYGESIKGYGRDHGGHREGRRNFIEHTERVDSEDGSKRTRVRFNIEGQYGTAFVFAEVSSQMDSGEFVYVLVQDKSNGRVQTVVDNRAALTASRLAGGNKESMAAMSQLLGGGKRSS